METIELDKLFGPPRNFGNNLSLSNNMSEPKSSIFKISLIGWFVIGAVIIGAIYFINKNSATKDEIEE
jgi:hypothetical protein